MLGDKGYSYPRVRRWCERRGIWDVIPQRSDLLDREGRRVFSRSIYKSRNMVERCVGWHKHNRLLGTRYEKLACHYLAVIKLAFVSRYLRLMELSDTMYLEAVSKLSGEDDEACDMQKGLVDGDFTLPADDQTPEVAQPRDRSLHDPAVSTPTQLPAVLTPGLAAVAPVWTDQMDAAFGQTITQRIRVVRPISDQIDRTITRQRRHVEGRFDERDLRGGRACQVHSERKTRAVRHHHELRTLSAFGRSHTEAPFFAGTNVPSVKTFNQLICRRSSSSRINATHARSHTPDSSHSLRRRRHVLADGYSRGRSFHRAPLRSTHRMPSKHSRFGIGGRPPLLDRSGSGSSGAIFSHCASVNRDRSLVIARTPSDDQVNHKPRNGASLQITWSLNHLQCEHTPDRYGAT